MPTKFPAIGGYENVVLNLAKCLAERIEVHVVCTGIDHSLEIPRGVKVFPIIKFGGQRYIGFLINCILNFRSMLRYCRKEMPDIINAHLAFPSGFIALPAKIAGIPIVCTSHGDDIQVVPEVGYGQRRKKTISLLLRYVLACSSAHTVVSQSMVQDAIRSGSRPDRVRVIHNGVDLLEICTSCTNAKADRELNLRDEDLIILFLGRLHSKKCPMDLIRAFVDVAPKMPNARLVFAGRGEEEKALKAFAEKHQMNGRIEFLGFVSNEMKWWILKRSDIFVLPSIVEGLAITLIEAMACGKAVVVSDIGPSREIVSNGNNGVIVPLHNTAELSQAIVDLLMNRDKRANLGSNARREIGERFDMRITSREYEKLYLDILGGIF